MRVPTKSDRILQREEMNKIPVMFQTWTNLLFIHWEADFLEIQKTLPEGLFVDRYKNKTYVGITPFSLNNLRLKLLPSIPGIRNFLETNVRTYVYDENGTPGIWFYSLDANQIIAVGAANLIPLPYKLADIMVEEKNGIINYRIRRSNAPEIFNSEFIYKPFGEGFYPDSESLDFFLVERYLLYFVDVRKRLKKIRVSHQPYPLKNVEVLKYDNRLINPDKIKILSNEAIHSIFSHGPGEVKIYLPE